MSRTTRSAALAGLLGVIAAAIVAVPASAATATVESIDFENGAIAPWVANGATVDVIADPLDAANNIASVTGRGADTWRGIASAVGAYDSGVEYTFSARVKLPAGAAVRFVANEPGASNEYVWVGNTTLSADTWTTVSGTHTFGANAENAKISLEVGAATDYLVDDILVTAEGPEECVPAVTAHSSVAFEDGTIAPWVESGAVVAVVAEAGNEANHVASVTGRGADTWRGISSAVGAYDDGVEYTFTARVKLPVGASVRFVANEPGASNEYAWVGNTTVPADTWTTISGTHTFGTNAENAKVSIEVSDPTDYLVDDVSVTYLSVCTDGPEPGTVAISTNFEDGLGGWAPRDNGTGAPSVAVTASDAHGGTQSALVSARTSQGSGIGYDVTDDLVAGTAYDLTAWVKFAQSPTEDIWLTLEGHTGDSTSYSTLAQFTGMSSGEWVKVEASFTMPTTETAVIYFETAYEGGETGNTSAFLVDDVTVVVPEPPVVQDVTPIRDTVDFPVGVAIDQRETLGAPADLLLKHFDQITPENYMKPEAWYDAEGNWAPNAAQIDTLMDFASENDIRIYGHVLVWHSQTPAWFFQDAEGNPLTSSEADKQILRDRMRTHINNVAEYLSQWGDFGDGNPVVAFDVVNEVIDDSSAYADGLRRSEWYRILGEEFVADAFTYAEQAFNGTYAADGADRPVTLFINDYNTEQSGKRGRYLALIDRLLAADVPVDGIGHQFHVSLSQPVETLDEALTAAASRGLKQAVTEFDVTTGTPESTAKFIDQGYYYRDAFEIFRAHAEQMFSVTVWGLNDARSWRDSSGGPLVFNDGFQVKPAYYGIVEPSGLEDPLPARLRTANSFAGDVPATAAGVASGTWKLLPLLPAGTNAGFQTRWAGDRLTVYVDVDDDTTQASDAVTVQIGGDEYVLSRAGGELGAVVERDGGYSAVLALPLTAAAEGDALQVDVRVTDGASTSGWNTTGATGTLTLVEALSHAQIPEAAITPTVDGALDDVWSTSASVQTIKQVSGSNGAIGTFHLLWKGQTLYVLAEVADPTVDVSGSDPWTQDSVEIYVDPGNAKNGSYRYDDTQIRINADNVVSFGTGDEGFQANRLDSATVRTADGYVVEAAISLLEYGGLGSIHGLDVQVNDASGGARNAIRNWADPTGAGYQSTARWGVASLVEGSLITQSPFTPAITGAAIVGKTLAVSGLPSGGGLTYRWLRNGSPIGGAVASTYVLTTADAGKKISVRVTNARAGYADRTATSAQTATVLKTFTKVTTPTIRGTAAVGKTVKASVSPWSPSASFKYQWYANGKAIPGATKSSLTLSRYQAGKTVTVKVTGSRSGYVSVTKVSAGKKVPLLALHVDPSRITGNTRVGGTLRVTPGASHPVATSKSYQWYADGKAISGATKSTFTATTKQHGKQLTAKVTYRATGYAAKVVTVGPTYRITWR